MKNYFRYITISCMAIATALAGMSNAMAQVAGQNGCKIYAVQKPKDNKATTPDIILGSGGLAATFSGDEGNKYGAKGNEAGFSVALATACYFGATGSVCSQVPAKNTQDLQSLANKACAQTVKVVDPKTGQKEHYHGPCIETVLMGAKGSADTLVTDKDAPRGTLTVKPGTLEGTSNGIVQCN